MVAAAKGLKLILVDCSKSNQHQALKSKYECRGYPTVVFTDSKGNKVANLGSRSADAIATQMREISAKYSRSVPWRDSVETAVAAGKKEGKPTLIFFAGKGARAETREGFFVHEKAHELLDKFVLVRMTYSKKCETCKSYKAKPNMLYFVDGAAPHKALQRTSKFKSPKALRKAMEKALRKYEKATKKREAAKGVDV